MSHQGYTRSDSSDLPRTHPQCCPTCRKALLLTMVNSLAILIVIISAVIYHIFIGVNNAPCSTSYPPDATENDAVADYVIQKPSPEKKQYTSEGTPPSIPEATDFIEQSSTLASFPTSSSIEPTSASDLESDDSSPEAETPRRRTDRARKSKTKKDKNKNKKNKKAETSEVAEISPQLKLIECEYYDHDDRDDTKYMCYTNKHFANSTYRVIVGIKRHNGIITVKCCDLVLNT